MSAEDIEILDDTKIVDSILKRNFKKNIINRVPEWTMKIKIISFSLEKILNYYREVMVISNSR